MDNSENTAQGRGQKNVKAKCTVWSFFYIRCHLITRPSLYSDMGGRGRRLVGIGTLLGRWLVVVVSKLAVLACVCFLVRGVLRSICLSRGLC